MNAPKAVVAAQPGPDPVVDCAAFPPRAVIGERYTHDQP